MHTLITKPNIEIPPPAPLPPPRNKRWLLFFLAFGAILYLAKELVTHWKDLDFLEVGPSGDPQPAKKDLEELAKDLQDIDNSEQYALLVLEEGYFVCYNCPGQDSIYLYAGEVWKYGATRKGETGRYPQGLEDKRLVYRTQFRGNFSECLKQEKIKIIYYRTLPENLKRAKPLKRPPGNKINR